MAAAGNHRVCQNDVQQTFLLTNIAPQVGVGFNRHSWNRLEKYVRKLVKSYENVYVCTGPLYLPYRLFTLLNMTILILIVKLKEYMLGI